MDDTKRIFLQFERLESDKVELEFDFQKDEENNVYIMGIASTPDINSAGFVVENQALLECWKKIKSEGKNVAVYEKHSTPIGKVVSCEEYNGKILVVMEIPKAGNERVLSVYNQNIYVGLSIGGWSLDGEWVEEEDVYHVTEFDWYEVSVTDIPANENALLLEYAKSQKIVLEEPQEPKENTITDEDIQNTVGNIIERIKEI